MSETIQLTQKQYDDLLIRIAYLEKEVAKGKECSVYAYNLHNRNFGKLRRKLNDRISFVQQIARKKDTQIRQIQAGFRGNLKEINQRLKKKFND